MSTMRRWPARPSLGAQTLYLVLALAVGCAVLAAGCSAPARRLDPDSLKARRSIALPNGKPLLVAHDDDSDRLYVTSSEPRALWRLDSVRWTFVKLDVGAGPLGLWIDRPRRRLFVCLSQENALAVVDLASNQLMYKIPVGLSPFDVVVTRDGKRAYVTHHDDDSLGVVDLRRKRVIKRLNVGVRPTFLTLSRDERLLVASNYGSHNVSIVDTRRLDVTATIVVDANPLGVAITGDGRYAFVANYHGQSVTQIDLATLTKLERHSVAPHPYSVRIRPQGGEVIVTHADSGVLSILAQGRWHRVVLDGGTTGLALSRDGFSLYLAQHPARRLSILRGMRTKRR